MSLTAVKRTITDLGWSGVQGLLYPAEPMDLDRDWPAVDALLQTEQWPFVRADFEVSALQAPHSAQVVRRDGEIAGFFVAHGFDDVAYLDMMIVGARWRRRGVARPLYVATQRALRRCRGTVVHSTLDSARIIKLLGFRASATYTLLARDPDGVPGGDSDPMDVDAAVALDTETFGVAREAWTGSWLRRPEVQAVGLHEGGALTAFLALRPRKDDAWGLDLLACPDPEHLPALVDATLARHGDRRLECFVHDGGPLDAVLRARGFTVPGFFEAIGPLVEWRKGQTEGVGDGPAVHSLLWL